MANPSTVAALYGLAGPTSSVETAVQFPTGYLGPNGASTSGTPLRAILGFGANANIDGRIFKVRACARFVATAASNAVLNVYWNCKSNTNLTTFTSDILVIGSGNEVAASHPCDVVVEAFGTWNSADGRLAMWWNEAAGLANVVTTPAVIKTSAAVTSTNPISASAITTSDLIQFFATMSSSGTTTSATLTEFSIDQI